jgi:hypothetical protein
LQVVFNILNKDFSGEKVLGIMRKYLPYILLLVILSVLMAWYLLTPNQTTLDEREGAFKVKDPARIGKVILHDDKKRDIVLEKKNGIWFVNDKYEARQDLIERLLEVVSRIESQAPVSKAAHENVLREMLASNIQVQVFYAGKSNPEKVYYVGGPTLDSKATYMLMQLDGKPASRPHIVRIPGFDGYLTPTYEVEEDVWRSRMVFNVNPESVKKLEVQYPENDVQSFSIEQAGRDSFKLLNSKGANTIVPQGVLYAYVSMYQGVQIEDFENENAEKDMILRQTPLAIISVTTQNGDAKLAKLFYMPVNRRSKTQMDEHGNDVKTDIDKLYIALNDDKDFGVAQIYVFGKLLRTFEEFTKSEPVK